MRNALTAALCALILAGCSGITPFPVEVVRSEIVRCPEATFLDGQEGRLKWNYTTGLELKSFLDVYDAFPGKAFKGTGMTRDSLLKYVDNWYDSIIDSTGTIYKYKMSNYSVDHVCPGMTLFRLYDITGREKYRMAMDTLYAQLKGQPRTAEGGFWHKRIYPGQMWLDGLYMAEPFYAAYTARFVPDSLKAACYKDIVHQFSLSFNRTLDPETRLLRHAWDSTGEMFWCNPDSGQSDHAWGRALGWYCMALVDVYGIMPEDSGREALADILRNLWETLPSFADPDAGVWYQVLDCPGREGNYLEATCSAMFAYSLLKGCRLGILDCRDYAEQTWKNVLKQFVTVDDGIVNLNSCCEVAGLGGKDNRRGDYDYYINEPVRSNDPKGIGPLVWAALEYERL